MVKPPKTSADASLLEQTADLERQVEQLELLIFHKLHRLNNETAEKRNPSLADLKKAAAMRPKKRR